MIKAGAVIDELALSIDLAPTMIELARCKLEHHIDGRSIVPLLRGEHPEDWRTSFLVEYNTDTVFPRVFKMGYRAIRTKRWKYIRFNELDGMDELYDLKSDPYELTNLIGDSGARDTLTLLQAELEEMLE